jgi:hypothetical protein
MADTTSSTQTTRELKIHEGGTWTTKTIVASTIGELRVALDIPNGVQININDTLYSDNTSPMPANPTGDDGATQPLFVGWQSNNKTGGAVIVR